jgi:hypothetical protein
MRKNWAVRFLALLALTVCFPGVSRTNLALSAFPPFERNPVKNKAAFAPRHRL